MVDKKIIGFLTILILVSGVVYINLEGEGLKFRIDNDKSTFYVLNENNRFIVAGREINSIWDGTSKMNRNRKEITVNTTIEGNIITIIRVTPYLRGAIIKDTYIFRGDIKDIEFFPISHKIEILNGNICGEKGCIYSYQINDLKYKGETKKLKGIYSMNFENNIKVEWNEGNYYSKIYKYKGQDKGKLIIKYRITSDYEVFYNKLFDPPLKEAISEYLISDIKIKNHKAKRIIFPELNRLYSIKNEANKVGKKPKDYLNIKKTKYFGDAKVKLMEKINVTKQKVKRTYECNCRNETINETLNGTKENKTIEKIIEVCDTCYEYENYIVEEIKEINPETFILKNNKPIYEVFEGCSKIEKLPNGKYGCLVWTDVNILGINIEGASWWNSSWVYKQEINLSNTAGNLTNYQVKINENLSAEYSAGKINLTGQDIRFTNSTDSALDYWVESCNFSASDNATFWVKVNFLGNATNTTIYMYYGNSEASSASNGNDTFNFFDDFPGDSIDTNKWEGDTGFASVSGGILTLVGGSGIFKAINSISNFAPDKKSKEYSKIPYTYVTQWGFAEGTKYTQGYMDGSDNLMEIRDAGISRINTNWSETYIYTKKEIRWGDSFDKVSWFEDGTELTNSPYTTGANIPDESLPYRIRSADSTLYYEWIFVGEYADPEPTYSIGSEETESAGGNEITISLNLDGLSEDRYYEHGTVCELKANVTNSTGGLIMSGFCHQEFVNVSTTCGGLDTGGYYYQTPWRNVTSGTWGYNATDGDWDTFGYNDSVDYIFFEYYKPANAVRTYTNWQVKDHNDTVNLTVHTNCWNRSPLRLYVKSEQAGGYGNARWYCLEDDNATVQILRSDHFLNNSHGEIYEEKMIWHLDPLPDNICLNIDQVDFGDNFICGNGSVSYNLTTNAVKNTFNDSSTSKNVSYSNLLNYSFEENWESGSISSNWTQYSSDTRGRIRVFSNYKHSGNYSLGMDTNSSGSVVLNEIISNYDFSGTYTINLDFWHRETLDEETAGVDHSGHYSSDAYYFTCDGNYWYHLGDLGNVGNTWTNVNINISSDPNFCSEVTSDFAIKITQRDNAPITNDGRMIDDITINYSILQNQTFHLNFNKHDDIQSSYIDLFGYENPKYPKNIKLYVNSTLQQKFTGNLTGNEFCIYEFEDSSTRLVWNKSGTGYPYQLPMGGIKSKKIKLPKINITNFTFNVMGDYYEELMHDVNQSYNDNHFDGDAITYNNEIYVIGGYSYKLSPQDETNVTEKYSPSLDTWTQLADYPMKIRGSTCEVYGDYIYCFGGWDSNENSVNNSYKYDISGDSWSAITNYPVNSAFMTASKGNISNGRIWIFGGTTGSEYSREECWYYNISANSYTSITDIPEVLGWAWAGTEAKEGIIYLMAGYSQSPSNSNELYIYNTSNGNYTAKTNMPYTAYQYSTGRIGNLIYVYGGQYADPDWGQYQWTDALYKYNITSDTWYSLGSRNPLNGYAVGYPSSEVNEKIYLIAGYVGSESYKTNLMYLSQEYLEDAFIAINTSNKDWEWSGEFEPDNGTQTVQMNINQFNQYLGSCIADSDGLCEITIYFGSDSAGKINWTSINLTYPSNNIELNVSLLEEYLNAQNSGYHNIPIRISSETNTIIQIDNINITYYGSDNISVTAHFDGDGTYSASNDTQIIKTVFSNYNISLPSLYPSDELIWSPESLSEKNCTPWGQSNSVPGWNITSLAYDQAFNLSIKTNSSFPACMNMTVDDDNTKSGGILINTSYQTIITNFSSLLDTKGIRWWLDLSACNRTDMAYIYRDYFLCPRCTSCVKGCE